MYKIPKLVHFESTLISNESNKTCRRKPTVGPRRTNSMSQNNANNNKNKNKNKIIGRKFNLKSFLWVQKEVGYH